MKNIKTNLSENFHFFFLVVKFSIYLNRRVFVMYNFDPFIPHFYSVKLGKFTGVYIFFFLFLFKNECRTR